jgi:type III restriction enzyme
VLSAADLPARPLDELKQRREQEVAFRIARLVLKQYDRTAGAQVWLFPQVLALVKRWLEECVTCTDGTFRQLLLMTENASKAAEKVHRAIAAALPGERQIRAILQSHDARGTTAGVAFDTTRPRWTTARDRCHLNFAPCDGDWELQFVQSLEAMDEVKAYVKNQHLGFKVPYTFEGRPGHYCPDYLLRVDDGRGDLLNLIVAVAGRATQEAEAKVATTRNLWVPSVNAEGTFGRWAFLELTDPRDVITLTRRFG